MTTGTIRKIEGTLATVATDPHGGERYFSLTAKSITHGVTFRLGQRVSLRFSRDNLRIVSVVSLQP